MKKLNCGEFPGSPVVKISPFSVGIGGLIHGQGVKW